MPSVYDISYQLMPGALNAADVVVVAMPTTALNS